MRGSEPIYVWHCQGPKGSQIFHSLGPLQLHKMNGGKRRAHSCVFGSLMYVGSGKKEKEWKQSYHLETYEGSLFFFQGAQFFQKKIEENQPIQTIKERKLEQRKVEEEKTHRSPNILRASVKWRSSYELIFGKENQGSFILLLQYVYLGYLTYLHV